MPETEQTQLQNGGGEADPALFLVEGVLSELHVEDGRENLLASIEKRYRGNSALTGAVAAAGELFGQADSALLLATYDGEDTENFACLIGGDVVCGQFAGASKLTPGSTVKAVVARRGEVLYAHALMDQPRAMLWTRHACGAAAERKQNLKLALGLGTFATFTMFLVDYFVGPAYSSLLSDFLVIAAMCYGMCLFVALWSSHTMQGLAGPATQAFRLLGFAEPEQVDLSSHMYFATHADKVITARESASQHKDVYCYQRALDSGALRYAR